MRIFIVDDEFEDRRGLLTKGFGGDIEIVVANSHDEAIKILERDNQFDVFMLDHDLGFIPNEEYDENATNGLSIARYIVQNNIGQSKLFIIHSTNIQGADNMAFTLAQDNRLILKASIGLMKRMPITYLELIQKHKK